MPGGPWGPGIHENHEFGTNFEQSFEQVWCAPNLLRTLQRRLEQVWSAPNLLQTLFQTCSEFKGFKNFKNSQPPGPPGPGQGPGIYDISEIKEIVKFFKILNSERVLSKV